MEKRWRCAHVVLLIGLSGGWQRLQLSCTHHTAPFLRLSWPNTMSTCSLTHVVLLTTQGWAAGHRAFNLPVQTGAAAPVSISPGPPGPHCWARLSPERERGDQIETSGWTAGTRPLTRFTMPMSMQMVQNTVNPLIWAAASSVGPMDRNAGGASVIARREHQS